jgi:glutaminyl-peptide cyclotransferase
MVAEVSNVPMRVHPRRIEPRRRSLGLLHWGGLVLGLLVLLAGCGSLAPSAGAAPPAGRAAASAPAGQDTAPELRFDRDRAWTHLVAQVEAGPRVPNTPGHATVRDYLLRELGAVMDSVQAQDFVMEIRGTPLRMSNIVGQIGADRPTQVLLAAHWDTRPTADQDPDPSNRQRPIAGANDGASGVAVLLEVARVLREVPPNVGVIVVFFDGEDYGPGVDAMFLGSRHYAANMIPTRPSWGILLDMIGDRDLQIPREGYSQTRAPAVNDRVWRAARELGRREFLDVVGPPILDDHLPLLDAGVPMIDLIDFSYGPNHSWWHTLADTPDKVSAASLEAVGQVVLRTLYNEP